MNATVGSRCKLVVRDNGDTDDNDDDASLSCRLPPTQSGMH